MSRAHVVEGAKLRCSCGDQVSEFRVPFDRMSFIGGKKEGLIGDCYPNVNIFPFGQCQNTANPAVAKATTANQGTLHPMPCIPAIFASWMNGKGDVPVDSVSSLLTRSTLRCQWGGVIRVVDNGQN